jgi:hypothetical protein
LPRALLAATEVMVVTRESNPTEVEALRQWCTKCAPVDPARWSLLGRLKSGQAVALPITEETGGDLRLFTMGARLTPHVRHREKYVDVPVSEQRAFLFSSNGREAAPRARTLRQFVARIERTAAHHQAGYMSRNDFSRWIGDVFGDVALAGEIRTLEDQYRAGTRPEAVTDVVNAIRARYDLSDDAEMPGGKVVENSPSRRNISQDGH